MRSIIISSNSSGGGKTTVTLAIMAALKERGYDVQGYKVGPDYIDPAFHRKITGKASRNLDIYLMGEDGIQESYQRGQGDLGIIEGVMGLYDGKGIDSDCSTAHVSRCLKLPVILVISPKAQVATLCAEIQGLRFFEDIEIAGVIFNKVSEKYYNLLKRAVEENCKGIRVFGYVPKDERISLESRHLGLVQSCEVEDLKERIHKAGELLSQTVDIDSMIQSFKKAELKDYNNESFHMEKKGIKIAVAYDKAFSFYYKENIEMMEEVGEVVYFSPLKDKSIPQGTDFIYLGGGYPEVFKEELSNNSEMIESIKESLDSGTACYAECGGLMYLTESIDGFKMVGFLKGSSEMTGKLNNFGYAEVNVAEENSILPKGLRIRCHEFHKSVTNCEEDRIYELSKESYDGTIKNWKCGYIKNNTLAAYAHIHFFSNREFLRNLIEK